MLNHGSGPLSTTYRRLGARRHAVPPESRMAAIGRKSGRAASAHKQSLIWRRRGCKLG